METATPTLLDCGHPEDKGTPYNNGTMMGWKSVIDAATGRNICHACADLRVLDCGHAPSPHLPITTGYATDSDTGATYCYECAAARDRDAMIVSGRATLYLVNDGTRPAREYRIPREPQTMARYGERITNWADRLSFPVTRLQMSRHNIAGRRYDAWFTGPDGFTWYAVTYGDNTQIAHCRRVTSRRSDGRRLSSAERAKYARQRAQMGIVDEIVSDLIAQGG